MGQFYIDDSIHDEAGFIIGACVYTNINLNNAIKDIIKTCGFDPDTFEYKSSTNYSKEPKKAMVREELKALIHNSCKLGIVVIPRIKRDDLGYECIKAIKQFIDTNELEKPIDIYIDQGMFTSKHQANQLIDDLNFVNCKFHLEQNSQIVKGIQLADLTAHVCSIQLKDALGLIKKTIKTGGNSGYDLDIELGFEMWATTRYTFFNEGSKPYGDDQIANATFKVEPYGLYVSEMCDENLAEIARGKFGSMYLGCIH